MTPDQFVNVLFDVLEKHPPDPRATNYILRNMQGITASVDEFTISGDSDYDNPSVRTVFRSFLIGCYAHKAPCGLFNIALPNILGRGLARLIASYGDFIEGDPYLTTLDALLQRQRMAWSDKDTDLPVDSKFIVAYDGDFCLNEYASARALEDFSRKINVHKQAFFLISEKPLDERNSVSNAVNTVDFKDLGFEVIDVLSIVEEARSAD